MRLTSTCLWPTSCRWSLLRFSLHSSASARRCQAVPPTMPRNSSGSTPSRRRRPTARAAGQHGRRCGGVGRDAGAKALGWGQPCGRVPHGDGRPGQDRDPDDPTKDVDPLRRRHLWVCIRRLADSGTAVLLVTHNVVETSGPCTTERTAVRTSVRPLPRSRPGTIAGYGRPRRSAEKGRGCCRCDGSGYAGSATTSSTS